MRSPRAILSSLSRRLLPGRGRRPVRWGSLRRGEPVSRVFGLDRGQPIDRHYIEAFLAENAADIRGRTLEAGDDSYTRRFGNGQVIRRDVLHVADAGNGSTLVADLADGIGLPRDAFDCLVLTQTLQFIYDIAAAARTCFHILRPGGVLLATFTGIGQISRYDMDRWGEYWRLTDASAGRLMGEVFGAGNVQVRTFGNVLAACALLQGLASDELTAAELDRPDPDYPVVVAVRAVKRENA